MKNFARIISVLSTVVFITGLNKEGFGYYETVLLGNKLSFIPFRMVK